MENGLKKQLSSKEAELKSMSSLINQKEENGNEIEYNLNQIKAQLINLKSEKEISENKLTHQIE